MTKRLIKDGIWFLTGSVLYALSVSVFSAPNELAPGGAAGLAVIGNALFGVPVGALVLLLNIPLLVIAFFKLSRRFVWRTVFVTVLSSVVMDVTAAMVAPFSGDRMLAALCGGLLAGTGIGIIMLRDGSTGGSEIAARLWQRVRPHMSVGRLLLLVDAAVVALSAVVFGDLSAALYAAVMVFVSSLMIDHIVYGREEGRLLLAVTAHPHRVSEAVMKTVSRGVTILDGIGGYTGANTAVLLCAVSRSQVPLLKETVYREDKAAFVMVVTTQQVFGEGFLPTGFEEIHTEHL